MQRGAIQLDARLIENFAGAYLSPRYDQPHPVAAFHREVWGLYCDLLLDNVAIAAPRKHAKSTSFTDAFMLAALLLRWRRYVIFFSATEELAAEHLSRSIEVLKHNDDVIRDFKIVDFNIDTKTDISVKCADGYMFRVTARGAGQKVRGRNWMNMRPDLLLGDDLESEENVSSLEIRKGFRQWFFRSAKQLLGEGGLTRVHGTILNDDSLLWNLTHSKSWTGRIYRAHQSYSNFSNILWSARFSEGELKRIQQEFIDAKDPAGYSCEMLNAPRDREDAYLNKDWFLPLEDHEKNIFRQYGVGVDLAISQSDNANSTVMLVGGKRIGGHCDVVDRRKGRFDAAQIMEELFAIQLRWSPVAFFIERGMIWEAIRPTLEAEMRERNIYLNIVLKTAVKDKAARGRPLQKRMKYGGMSFDKDASWYSEYESVMLLFTAESEAREDDDFDATAWLTIGLEELPDVEPEDDMPDDEYDLMVEGNQIRLDNGRSQVTGY